MRNFGSERVVFEDPPFTRYLFNDTRFAWVWLVVRLYVGYTWLTSGLGKVTNPGWTQTGEALRGFWQGSVATLTGAKPPITFDWYRDFILFLLNGGHY
ncbi:MAG: DoxX family protein, partial [Chloroflexota bacterium]